MKLFVTGGTGFIGSHFLNAALSAGHHVVALRRSSNSRPRIPLIKEPEWINKTMGQVSALDFSDCDVLVHLAATGVDLKASWDECFEVNVSQSLRLWIQAADAGIRNFVICGSCFEYGKSGERYEFIPTDAPLEPTGGYHASKAAASMAALALAYERELSLKILRPFHVFGEGENEKRFWPSLRAAAMSGHDFNMTEGAQVRDFIYVSDVAETFLEVARSSFVLETPVIRNLGSGKPSPLVDFARKWWKSWGAKGELLIGTIAYRKHEVMRYVPLVD